MTPGPRDRLLATATDMIRQHGVASTGLTELLKRSRTARGSIYQHFPRGKDELVAASVRQAGETSKRVISNLVELGDAAAVIAAMMNATKAALEEEMFSRGCPVVAAAVAGPEYPVSVNAAGEVFAGWVHELGGVLVTLGVPVGVAPALASLVISSFEGALIQARSTRSLAPIDHAAEQLVVLARSYTAAA